MDPRWILITGLILSGNEVRREAYGPFSNEKNCWKLLDLINKTVQREHQYLGRCMDEETFKSEYPEIQLERDST